MKGSDSEFDKYTVQNWLDKAEKELKGKPLEALNWDLEDNMSFAPIYFNSPEASDFSLVSSKSSWVIGEKYLVQDPKATNKAILAALNMGLEGVHLVVDQSLSEVEWSQVLDKVLLKYITLALSHSQPSGDQWKGLAAYLERAEVEFVADQILIEQGLQDTTLPSLRSKPIDFIINADTPATTMAQTFHSASQVLRAGLEAKQAAHTFYFRVGLSKSFYLNVVYLQSLKIIWQNMLDAHGADPHTPIYIMASAIHSTGLDENTQMINATVQSISAVVAGIDFLEIETKKGDSNADFNRRIHRNIQHLLKLESGMDFVENPTEGSYYFDNLTKDFSQKVWANFQDLT